MSRMVQITVEPLTEEAFRPFGELISATDRPADSKGVNSEGWKAASRSMDRHWSCCSQPQ